MTLQPGAQAATLPATGAGAPAPAARDLGREILAADLGWTSALHDAIDTASRADVARGAGVGRAG
jgi:hypothetical protein